MLNEDDFKKQAISKNEDMIAKAMRYLKYQDPQHANREDAISYLEFVQTVGEQAAHVGSIDFDEFFRLYQQQK